MFPGEVVHYLPWVAFGANAPTKAAMCIYSRNIWRQMFPGGSMFSGERHKKSRRKCLPLRHLSCHRQVLECFGPSSARMAGLFVCSREEGMRQNIVGAFASNAALSRSVCVKRGPIIGAFLRAESRRPKGKPSATKLRLGTFAPNVPTTISKCKENYKCFSLTVKPSVNTFLARGLNDWTKRFEPFGQKVRTSRFGA